MANQLVYVVLNGELKMSSGKAAAQAVHAVAMLPDIKKFGRNTQRTVIVLESKDTKQLLNLTQYLRACNIPAEFYIDEGVNEVDAYSVTALAVGPIWDDDLQVRELFYSLPLYGKKKSTWFGR